MQMATNEFCDPCKLVAGIVSKYTVSSFESNTCDELDHDEMMMIVHYVNQINELKASCRCFVKSIDTFWNFMAVVRKIFIPLKTVIDKLDEDCLLLQQMRQIIAENSNESMESDDNVDDLETGGFSLKERFDILRCCAVLVNENFYLYSTYQRHYLHIPVQIAEPTSRVKKHFMCSNLSGPVIFVLDALVDSNLLQRLVTCLSKSKLSINPEIVASMMLIMLTIRPYSLDSTLRRYLWPIRDLISNYVCELADNNDGEVLRDHSVRQLSEHVWTLSRDYISANNVLDSAGLNLSLKHLHSHFLAARLTGLHHLCVIINCSDENDAEETSSALAEYILHRKIVQLVFGPNLHVELIKQSHILLNFACLQCILTKSDLDSIWAAALMKHCNRQVLDLLNCTIKCMEYDLVDHLYGLLKTLKPSEHNDLTLLLTFTVIKYIWNYKTYDSRRALLKPLVKKSAESLLRINEVVSVNTESEDKKDDCRVSTAATMTVEVDEASSASSAEESSSTTNSCELHAGSCESRLLNTKRQLFGPRSQPVSRKLTNSGSLHTCRKGVVRLEVNRSSRCKRNPLASSVRQRSRAPVRTVNSPQTPVPADVDETIAVNCLLENAAIGTVGDDEEENGSSSETSLSNDPQLHHVLKYVKRTQNPILNAHGLLYVEGGRPMLDFSLLANNALFESLVKNKIQGTRSKSYRGGTDSDVSSDVATSSGRMGDFDDEIGDDNQSNESKAAEDDDELAIEYEDDNNSTQLEKNQPQRPSCSVRSSLSLISPLPSSPARPKFRRLSSTPDKLRSIATWHRTGISKVINHPQISPETTELEICQPGQTLLWDLLQDDSYGERLSPENEELALQYLQDLFISEPFISRQFVKACLENLKKHKSSVISFKLLAKLFHSFRQITSSQQIAAMAFWSDIESNLLNLVLEDLSVWHAHSGHVQSRYGAEIEIKVRLNFLDLVYSNRNFFRCPRMSYENLKTIWDCFDNDDSYREYFYMWLLEQLKNPQRNTVDYESVGLFLQSKASSLNATSLSATGLALLSALLKDDRPEVTAVVLPIIWQVALKNMDTNVAMGAMQLVNNFYVYGNKSKEEDFVECCMQHLSDACLPLNAQGVFPESDFVTVQRALNLLYSHVEAFRKKHCFLLRILELEDINFATPHNKKLRRIFDELDITPTINVYVKVEGEPEMSLITLSSSALIGELRAEILYVRQRHMLDICNDAGDQDTNERILEYFSSAAESSRMYANGREMSRDIDCIMLFKFDIKDKSTITVRRLCQAKSFEIGNGNSPTLRSELCLSRLINSQHWQLLMNVIEKLDQSTLTNNKDISFRCKTYSTRAWQVIQCLPSNEILIQSLTNFLCASKEQPSISMEDFSNFFQVGKRHMFLYMLQLVEIQLSKLQSNFVKKGGFKFVIDALSNCSKCSFESENYDPWPIEIIISLLRITYSCLTSPPCNDGDKVQFQLSTQSSVEEVIQSPSPGPSSSKFGYQPGGRSLIKRSAQRQLISRAFKKKKFVHEFNIATFIDEELLSQIKSEGFVHLLMNLVADLASDKISYIYGGSFVRIHGIDYCFKIIFALMTSLKNFGQMILSLPNLKNWLDGTLLDCCDALIRREIGNDLYKLCRKKDDELSLTRTFIVELLSILEKAVNIPPTSNIEEEEDQKDKSTNNDKEINGISSKQYFWVISTLLDHFRESCSQNPLDIDLNLMCGKILNFIKIRPIYENREDGCVDHGLIGLLQLAISLIKFSLAWCRSSEQSDALDYVFDMIFLPPTRKAPSFPKCKSHVSRMTAYDLLVEMAKSSEVSFLRLHHNLMRQNSKESHSSYPWDYWPKDERRSSCGFVGITNLGATCYMASAVQQLFMIPQFRNAILGTCPTQVKEHEPALKELQKLFSFLLVSERKSYNPKSFCKNYSMNHQPLNFTEQKDMNEFFTDLITKVDEMNPELRKLVKNLFGGIMSNNVLSLDCCHVSKTTEIFYSVRCPVADMKNLYDSLNSMTVADMLEGDNMYTCSQCNRKVRAEKRACFLQLPKILCFNTLRYTFNMITMTKEKVNTHFSFPMRLNMSAYMEENLLSSYASAGDPMHTERTAAYDYELIGVTVHTGTADGGHYYSFIRDRSNSNSNNWYSFNDAEVRPWDPANIDSECFGGELTKQQYDTISDRFMDLPCEKTNSAYMLFYERISPPTLSPSTSLVKPTVMSPSMEIAKIPAEYEDCIYQDNTQFVQDLIFFDHSYSDFVSQICCHVTGTLFSISPTELTLMSAKLSLSFLLETLIHSKEKPTLTNWTELVIKFLSSSPLACEWLLAHTSLEESNWLTEILISCPQRVIREMFQKLCLHAILQLQLRYEPLYLLPWQPGMDVDLLDSCTVGKSCQVTQFIRRLISLMSNPSALDSRQLNEYFGLVIEFGLSSKIALKFLLLSSVISSIITFYLLKSAQENFEVNSEDESDEDNGLLLLVKSACGLRNVIWSSAALEKILRLLSMLLQTAVDDPKNFKIRSDDWALLISAKGFLFLMQIIKDCNNYSACGALATLICQLSPSTAPQIIDAIFEKLQSAKDESVESYFAVVDFMIQKTSEIVDSDPKFNFDVVNYIVDKIWQLAAFKPVNALKWFERNLCDHDEVYEALKTKLVFWTDTFLFNAANCAVRNCAGDLLIACVKSTSIRVFYQQICQKSLVLTTRAPISSEATKNLHEIYSFLLSRLPTAATYADAETGSTQRLVAYFNVLKACLVSKDEKLMVVPYFDDLWRMYRVHMCDKQVKIHANKQAVLTFWYMASLDCSELVQAAVQNTDVQQHFMYTYIFNHNDDEQIDHNKKMLHAFYGLMRLFCTHSPSFAESVMMHENFEFACRSVSMNDVLGNARDEIFSTIEICMRKFQSQKDKLKKFREKLCTIYLGAFSTSKTHYFTFLRFMRLFETEDDKIHLLQNQILPILSNNFFGVHEMHHNATGCCCINELIEMLRRMLDFLKFVVALKESAENEALVARAVNSWSNLRQTCQKLLELLNSYNPNDMRKYSLECLKRIVVLCDPECVKKIMMTIIHTHRSAKFGNNVEALDRLGPYFPRRSHALSLMSQQHLRKVHPPHPMFNMCLHPMLMEANKGIDTCYDQYMNDFFSPYHTFVDRLLRVACNLGTNLVSSDQIAECSGLIGLEGSALHSVYYVKFWLDLWQKYSEGKDVKERIESLKNSKFLREYVETILLNEQSSLSVAYIFSFMKMVLNELSPDLVTSQIKKQCLENAGDVLKEQINWPTVNESAIFERIVPMLATRIGALRIILLFSHSAKIVESLKSENFCQLIDEWAQKFKETLSACEIITMPAAECDAQSERTSASNVISTTINIRPCTSSQAISSTMTGVYGGVNVPCWLNVETKQQILKLGEILNETVSELKEKIAPFEIESRGDTDAA